MTIQQAIEKAIEGGWKKGYISSKFPNGIAEIRGFEWGEITGLGYRSNGELGTKHWHIGRFHSAWIDPLFWQSLGKAMGWRQDEDQWGDRAEWASQLHRFIDHLIEGKTPEQFFESL